MDIKKLRDEAFTGDNGISRKSNQIRKLVVDNKTYNKKKETTKQKEVVEVNKTTKEESALDIFIKDIKSIKKNKNLIKQKILAKIKRKEELDANYEIYSKLATETKKKVSDSLLEEDVFQTLDDFENWFKDNLSDISEYRQLIYNKSKTYEELKENTKIQKWARLFIRSSKNFPAINNFDLLIKSDTVKKDTSNIDYGKFKTNKSLAALDKALIALKKKRHNLSIKESTPNEAKLKQALKFINKAIKARHKSIEIIDTSLENKNIDLYQKLALESKKHEITQEISNLNCLDEISTEAKNTHSKIKDQKIQTLNEKIQTNLIQQLLIDLKTNEYGHIPRIEKLLIDKALELGDIDQAIDPSLYIMHQNQRRKITKFEWLKYLFRDEYFRKDDEYENKVFKALAALGDKEPSGTLAQFPLGPLNELKVHIALAKMEYDNKEIKEFTHAQTNDFYDDNGIDFWIKLKNNNFFALQCKSSKEFAELHKTKYNSDVLVASGKSISDLANTYIPNKIYESTVEPISTEVFEEKKSDEEKELLLFKHYNKLAS